MRTLDQHIAHARTSTERAAHAVRALNVARVNNMFQLGDIEVPVAVMMLEDVGLRRETAEQMALAWHAYRTVQNLVRGAA